MPKKHIYFVPGLAANSKIFERISLPKETFEVHFLEWIIPNSRKESIEAYAKRLSLHITHNNPILIGVSFGGVMVQEISKLICFEKVIIISSIKSRKELPKRLKLAQKTGLYKLFPSKTVQNIEHYKSLMFTDFLKKRAELYKTYLSVRDPKYIEWAIDTILNWQQEEPLEYVQHIHGNKDEVFPYKNIHDAIEISKGSHVMIINKAKTISKILADECVK